MEGPGSHHQAYQHMAAGFQQQNFGQTAPQPQFHTFDQNGVGTQHQASNHMGPTFQNPYYQQTFPGVHHQVQNNGQDQHMLQPLMSRDYGGHSFRDPTNQYVDFVPGNIAHGLVHNHPHAPYYFPANQGPPQFFAYGNGAPEQRRIPLMEANNQYQHQGLIQNLHQNFPKASQQSSHPNGQSKDTRQDEMAFNSALQMSKDRQNKTKLRNSANSGDQLETTPGPYSGLVPFKNPTPNTAPPLMGGDTPTPDIDTRRAQTAFRVKAGPLRGQSMLWRNDMASLASPEKGPHPVSSVGEPGLQSQHHGPTIGLHALSEVEDPFIERGYASMPQTMQMAAPKVIDVGPPVFATNEPPPGSVVPLTIAQQANYGPSAQLAQMCPNGAKPSIETALIQTNLPFIEIGRQSGPVSFGVLRIGNIPYATSRAELIAFLGRNARIVNENLEPVHIIMDRVSGKTEEAFVEFISFDEVISAVRRYENNRRIDRGGLVGDRHVTLEVSSQEQLMGRLFPRAKNVHWNGAQPVIIPADPRDIYNSGFKGFVNQEEMVMLIKHVEHPSRTPFARECPQRPFECLISTLVKFPWYMTSYVTIADRDIIYDGTITIIKQLIYRVTSHPDHITLNTRLLKRLCHAALRCSGFSEMQKDNIAFVCDIKETGLAPFADHWHVFKVLGPKYGMPTDILLYYMALIREATSSPEYVSLAEQAAMSNNTSFGNPNVPSAFGNFRVHYPSNFRELNMATIGEIEWNAVDKVLRKILGPTHPYTITE